MGRGQRSERRRLAAELNDQNEDVQVESDDGGGDVGSAPRAGAMVDAVLTAGGAGGDSGGGAVLAAYGAMGATGGPGDGGEAPVGDALAADGAEAVLTVVDGFDGGEDAVEQPGIVLEQAVGGFLVEYAIGDVQRGNGGAQGFGLPFQRGADMSAVQHGYDDLLCPVPE